MQMTLRNRSVEYSYVMRVLLWETTYPPNLPAVHSKNLLVDQVAWRNTEYNNAREKIQEYYDRIKSGGELSISEIIWFDEFCYQAGYLMRHNCLDDLEVCIDGVWQRQLISKPLPELREAVWQQTTGSNSTSKS